MGPTGHLVTIRRSGVDGPHFPLSLRSCLLGRGIECDIRIQLPVVSKQHCKIEIHEQKATLFNFSSTNPTKVNGAVIDEPVQLKHGDVITIIDRSFRYENESHQNGSTSTEFPGQRNDQVSLRQVSMPSIPDGKVQDPKTCSKLTEERVWGRQLVPVGEVRAARRLSARGISGASEGPIARETDLPGDDITKAAHPTAGDAGGVSSVTVARSGNGAWKPFGPVQCLDNKEENDSPFRKLYESMKEELDMSSEKASALRGRRKSAPQSLCPAENQRAGGSRANTPRQVSPKSRWTSGRSTHTKADPAAAGAQGSGQTEEERTGGGPALTPTETTKTRAPGRRSHPSPALKRRSGDLRVVHGDEPGKLDESGQGSRAEEGALLPRTPLTRDPRPAQPESADKGADALGTDLSRKRRRASTQAHVHAPLEAETQKQMVLAPLLLQAEKTPHGAHSASGHRGPGSPGSHAADISNAGDSLSVTEGMPLKRRRVSFGSHLKPELFDENLPPNTPLKRGETPMKRRSLATCSATSALKKIIKEQPQPSGTENSSSEAHLGATAHNVFLSSLARSPVQTPDAGDKCRRSCEPSSTSQGGSESPQGTVTPKRGGRRSSSGPSKRLCVDRTQQEILQVIHSKRRSGASEANLIVAKSWADIVKLSAKQTPAKVITHGPRRQPNKRRRRINTPKKPTGGIHNQFSTGHANSPCTIVVGRAHIEKVNVPARPYRMLNNFVFNKKIDFNEDLSGLTEMFKTPTKEKPHATSMCPISFSNSEDFHEEKVQVLKSEETPLLGTPEHFGDGGFPSTQSAPEQTSDKSSTSPALGRHCFTVNRSRRTLPSEAEPPQAASSTNQLRRSMELRNTQAPGANWENKETGADAAENLLGRCLRKTQREENMKDERDSGRTFEKNSESKENFEKMKAVKRSRRSSEAKSAQRADLTTPKRLQETEPQEDLVDIRSLRRTPGHTKEPGGMENRSAAMHCPEPDPMGTSARMNTQTETPSQKVSVGELSALGRPTQTPGEATHSHGEPVGDDKIIKIFKETPGQKLDSAENVTGSRRRSRTPRRKVRSPEVQAGFEELFQTPNRTAEPVADDKTTKMPHKSPKPAPVNSAGGDNDIRAFMETPEETVDSAENVTRSRRRSRTPRRKVQPLEDVAGLKELFQTPNRTAEPVADDKTAKIPHKSPKPAPVKTPTSTKRHHQTPLQKVDGDGDLSALRRPTQTPGEAIHSPGEPVDDDKDMKAFMETPDQIPDSAGNITASKRRSRTPKRKAQFVEDLAGFEELFQTPSHTAEPVTDDKVTKILRKSPKPEPVGMPGVGKDIRAFMETPEETVDSAENVTRSRRRSRTPRRKVKPLEDLAGLKELFQTPNRIVGPVTDDKTTQTPCRSPQPEPVVIATSVTRQLKTPPCKVSGEEGLSALRKSARTARGTVGSPMEAVGDGKSIEFFKEAPELKLDSAENVTVHKRKSGTPKRKVQPPEDLAGLKELFQTPNHTVEPVTNDKTLHKSPKTAPVDTPTSTKRHRQTPLQKVDGDGDLSALRRPTQTPGETTHSPGETVGDDEDMKPFMETPDQIPDSAGNITASKRRSRTPKRKAQFVEDLAGFEELFQTPSHTAEPVTDDKVTKILPKSPKPASVNSPGGNNDMRAFKETPDQKRDPTETVTGSRRRSRTPRSKVQPLEDVAGLKELFQTPNCTVEPVADDKTAKIPCKSPKPVPVDTPTSTKRHRQTPLQKVDGDGDLSALRRPTQTPGETTHSPEPVGDDETIVFFKETPDQILDSAGNITASKRRSRTPKRKAQFVEDLAGFEELFQTPSHTAEPVTDDKVTKILRKSPKPEPVGMPGVGKDIRVFMETPEETVDSAENVTRSRRRSRTPRRKVKPLEDVAGLKELFQTPNRTAEPVADDKTAKMPHKSPKPEPVKTPTSSKRHHQTPLQKVDGDGDLSALRRPTQTPGETTHSPGETVGDDETIVFFEETPDQIPDSAGNITASKRRSRTPKRKAQFVEDLAGFEELFQTPSHTAEPVTDDKVTKILRKSPKPEPVDMPGVGKDIRAFMETPDQKLGSAENVTRSRRRSRTPRRKVKPLEDLAGLKELFQTPNCIVGPVTDDKTTQTPCRSPQPEPVVIATSVTRQLKTPPCKVSGEEGLSALRKSARTARGTVGSPMEAVGDGKSIEFFKEAPELKLDSAENVTVHKRKSGTPKRKVQPLEDLAGLKELFQTPNHTVEPVTNDKTLHKSPKTAPVDTPTSTKRHCQTPLQKVDGDGDLSALRRPTQTPGETTHSPGEPVGDDETIVFFEETPDQIPDSAGNITASKRRSRTPKRKAQFVEDLAGFEELFQTPSHTAEPVTDDKVTKILRKSPKPEPVGMPGVGKDIRAFMETPDQKLGSAENVIGKRKSSRRPKRKVQPLEDVAGLKELFQTPKRTAEQVTDGKTAKIPCKSPQAEADIPTGRKSCLKAPPGKADTDMGPSALRKPTRASRKTTRSHREPEADDKDGTVFKESAEQKPDPAKNIARSKRKPRTPKEEARPLEDLADLKELSQTSGHTDQPVTNDKATRMACQSPQPGPGILPSSRKRQLQAPPGKAEGEQQPSTLRKPMRAARSTRAHREPAGGHEDVTVCKESAEQKPDPAKNVARGKRKPRTPKEEPRPLEYLADLKELSGTPDHTDQPVTDDKATRMACQSPQPVPGILPSSKKRRLQAPPGKADTDMGPSALRKPTRASRKTTRSHREPEADDKDGTVFKESAEQKPDPAKNIARSKRKPRTPKEEARPLEDLADLKELSGTPDHTDQPVTDDKATRMACQSPQPVPGILPSSRKRRLQAPPGKADTDVEPSALRKPTRASRKTTRSHREPEADDKDGTVFMESAEQKPDPAKRVTGGKRKPRTPKEEARPLEDLADLKELSGTPDHTDQPVTDDKATRMACQSPQPGPGILPSSKKRRLQAPPGKAEGEQQPAALRKPTRTARSTRAHREPAGGHEDVTVCQGPKENTKGSKRLLRTRKEEAPPPEGPAGCQELPQTADPDRALGSSAEGVTATPMHAPDGKEPVKASRRVLRAPRRKPMDHLASSRDPLNSQSESSLSQSPTRCGTDGTVTGRKRRCFATCPQDTALETPLRERQGTAPRERSEPPEALVTKKESRRRALAGRCEPVEDPPRHSVRTRTRGREADGGTSPDQGVSLRSRRPNKASGAERGPEFPESAGRIQVTRSRKKAPNTSQEATLQNLEAGAKKSTSGGQVRERRKRSRPGQQSAKPLPDATGEEAPERSVDPPVAKTTQDKKEGSPRAGSVCLKPRRKTVPPTEDTSEKESEQKGTRCAARAAEKVAKEDDNVCVKKLRTRRQ